MGAVMRKHPQVTEQTRANLMQAFWDLYLEKPIEKITIREITDRAGYNRATFYLYYRDVYDLFDQLEESILGQVRQLVNDRLLGEETLDFTHHMGFILELAQRFATYMPKLLTSDPSFSARLKVIIAPLLDRFILPARNLSEEERYLVREFYTSGVLSAITAWMMTDPAERMPIDRLIALIVKAVGL